jgi:hypothetical protein
VIVSPLSIPVIQFSRKKELRSAVFVANAVWTSVFNSQGNTYFDPAVSTQQELLQGVASGQQWGDQLYDSFLQHEHQASANTQSDSALLKAIAPVAQHASNASSLTVVELQLLVQAQTAEMQDLKAQLNQAHQRAVYYRNLYVREQGLSEQVMTSLIQLRQRQRGLQRAGNGTIVPAVANCASRPGRSGEDAGPTATRMGQAKVGTDANGPTGTHVGKKGL